MARIYGKRFDGKVFEIQNWVQSKAGDALVMQTLSTTQTRTLHQMRAKGCSDSQIWRQLHPIQASSQRSQQAFRKPAQFQLAVETLAKDQLIWLIENTMDTTIESLGKMTRADLIKLAIHVGGGKNLQVRFAA